jgi:hypothetical protein
MLTSRRVVRNTPRELRTTERFIAKMKNSLNKIFTRAKRYKTVARERNTGRGEIMSTAPRAKRMFSVAALILAACFCASAQTGTATLSGVIQDPKGAIVPGTDVTITRIETNATTTTKTNGAGVYVFTGLMPGHYHLQLQKPGFKQIAIKDFELHVQDQLQQNFSLEIGSVSESVTVNANAEHMESDNPAVGVLVNRDFVENMPLNGRSFQDLIALAPGAVSSANDQGLFSINGQRDDGNYYSIDGVGAPTNPIGLPAIGEGLSGIAPGQTALGTTQSLVSVDALEEFKIQTSTYGAEYGRQPGGQVEFRTRSGTNDFHGSVFDYFRNEAMDANGYFENLDGIPREPHRQNDFGDTFGGPILIPKPYNGHSRTFFFFSYEGLRLRVPAFIQEDEPTVALRQSAAASVQPYLNAYPIPNGPANNDGLTAQFNAGISNPSSFDAVSIRLDHTFNEKLQVFGRYSDTPSSQLTYFQTGEFSTQIVNTQTVTLGSIANLGPNLTDELRFNYSTIKTSSGYEPTNLGGAVPLPSDLLTPKEYAGVGSYGTVLLALPGSAVGVSEYITGTATSSNQKQFNVINTIAWTRGAHSLKFGADWRRLAPTFALAHYVNLLEFTSLSAIQQGLASLQFTIAGQLARPVFDNLSLFAQDSWKLTPRLSLDYGLRWELNPVPGASNGKYPPAVTQTTNIATMQLAPAGTPLYSTNYHQFAPRFGFAYEVIPSAKHALVIRGGGGVFYDTGQNLAAAGFSGYPFIAYSTFNSNVPLPLQAPSFVPPSLNVPLTPPYPALNGLSDPHLTLPYTEQWSLSLDQQLSQRNTLTLSYVGNVGRKLLYQEADDNIAAVNPNFTSVFITSNSSASSYNGLQVQDQGYLAPGLQVLASYTWAHARDNASADNGGSLQPIWGNSDNDIRQIFNLASNYHIPSTHATQGFLHTLTSGWLLSNRFEALSGYPFNVVQGAYCPAVGAVFCPSFFPNLVPRQPIYLHNVPNVPGGWQLNPNALSPVPTDPSTGAPLEQGTLGRNFLRGPSFWNLNTSLERNFSLHDRLSLAFRVDAFNIFNHPNLTNVDPYLGNATFGQPTGQASLNAGGNYGTGQARSLQLSLKLHF